jgi:hypothetical protein
MVQSQRRGNPSSPNVPMPDRFIEGRLSVANYLIWKRQNTQNTRKRAFPPGYLPRIRRIPRFLSPGQLLAGREQSDSLQGRETSPFGDLWTALVQVVRKPREFLTADCSDCSDFLYPWYPCDWPRCRAVAADPWSIPPSVVALPRRAFVVQLLLRSFASSRWWIDL